MNETKHLEIAAALEREILAGSYKNRLPPMRLLSERFNVSLRTVHKAVRALAGHGLVAGDSTRGNRIVCRPRTGVVGVFCDWSRVGRDEVLPATLRTLMERDGVRMVMMDLADTALLRPDSELWNPDWADGYLFIYSSLCDAAAEMLRRNKVPFLSANRQPPERDIGWVDFDHAGTLCAVLERLRRNGWRNVALDCAIASPAIDAEVRAGLTARAGTAGPDWRYTDLQEGILPGTFDRKELVAAHLERLFALAEPPEVLIAWHHELEWVHDSLRRHGLEPGRDLTIVTMDAPGTETLAGVYPLVRPYAALARELWNGFQALARGGRRCRKLVPFDLSGAELPEKRDGRSR